MSEEWENLIRLPHFSFVLTTLDKDIIILTMGTNESTRDDV